MNAAFQLEKDGKQINTAFPKVLGKFLNEDIYNYKDKDDTLTQKLLLLDNVDFHLSQSGQLVTNTRQHTPDYTLARLRQAYKTTNWITCTYSWLILSCFPKTVTLLTNKQPVVQNGLCLICVFGSFNHNTSQIITLMVKVWNHYYTEMRLGKYLLFYVHRQTEGRQHR